MMDFITSIVTGVLASLVAAFVWLYIFGRLRPNVAISQHICKSVDAKGRTAYMVKVINKGGRPIVDVRAKLVLVTPLIVPSGFMGMRNEIRLTVNEIMVIDKFDSKDQEAGYAQRFMTYEDLESIWQDDRTQYVTFMLYAVDSLSGLGKYFDQRYRVKRVAIVNGDFEFGPSLQIK